MKFYSCEFYINKLLIYNILFLGNRPGVSNSGFEYLCITSCREMGHDARAHLVCFTTSPWGVY